MKVLCVGDLHGRKEICHNAIQKFLNEEYDKIIFMGDYVDSFDRTNEDMLDVLGQVTSLKQAYNHKVVLLIGNHDWSYFMGKNLCDGFRADLNAIINPFLRGAKEMFELVHEEGKYLFSHAGIQRKWLTKHLIGLNEACGLYGLYPIARDNYTSLNQLIWTGHNWRFYEYGPKRGGMRGDLGSPLWCDKVEMESYGPIRGYHQVVGHTGVPSIERVEKFEGGKKYRDTSVTFIDCLGRKEEFLTLEI